MVILERFNYYGSNRRSARTAIEYRMLLSAGEQRLFRDSAAAIREDILGMLRSGGVDEAALGPLLEPLPESGRAAFSFLASGIGLALQRGAGHRVGFRAHILEHTGRQFAFVFEQESSEAGLPAGKLAFDLIMTAAPRLERPGDWPAMPGRPDHAIRDYLRDARQWVLPPVVQAIIDACSRLDVPVVKLDRDPYAGVRGDFRVYPNGMLQLGHARHKRILDGTFCIERPDLARMLRDRVYVNRVIRRLGLPPAVRMASRHFSPEDALSAARQLGFPVNALSLDRGAGGRAELGLRDEASLLEAVRRVGAETGGVVIERHAEGAVLRILTAGFRVVDAVSSGQSVRSLVHPDFLAAAEAAARRLRAGLLLMTVIGADFTAPPATSGSVVVDLDIAPDFHAVRGLAAQSVAEAAERFVRWLFPPGTAARIPLVAVTGSDGKSTTTKMIGEVARAAGFHPGLATTAGVIIDGVSSGVADLAGTVGHARVFESDIVDFGVLETARGGIAHSGIIFDHCNVAVCGSVTRDHLGQHGVDTWEDMVLVKRSVLERATDAVVVNIEDPGCRRMLPFGNGPRLGLVSIRRDAPEARELAADENAVFAGLERRGEGEVIVIDEAGERIEVMAVGAIPATHEGRLRYNVLNALHAVLASHLAGLGVDAIRAGLRKYDTSYENLPGRMNVHDGLPFTVILNFMSSPEAVGALCDYIDGLEVSGRKIILFAAFGNKVDSFIRDTVRSMASSFDQYCLRDFDDLRGRQPGEVMNLVEATLLEAGIEAHRILRLEEGATALEQTLGIARAGDLVVVQPKTDEIEDFWRRIVGFEVSDA